MESLNLNMLANSLPPSNLANAEKDLTNNFKAAALSLTTLYRSSRRTSKRAYNAGYASACQDLLLMIQQGVSAGESSDSDGQGMTIGRIMDYVEARLEAIKSREEEEDEDEEKERDRTKPGPSVITAAKSAPAQIAKTPAGSVVAEPARNKDIIAVAPPTPNTPSSFTPAQSSPSVPASPSPPSPSLRPIPHHISQSFPLQRTIKNRIFALSNGKEPSVITPTTAVPFPFDAPSTAVISHPRGTFDTQPPTSTTSDVAIGSKRRHNVMMLESANAPVTPDGSGATTGGAAGGPSAGATRRRTRSSRGSALSVAHQLQVQDQNQGADAMDVEEDGGRERKRLARR